MKRLEPIALRIVASMPAVSALTTWSRDGGTETLELRADGRAMVIMWTRADGLFGGELTEVSAMDDAPVFWNDEDAAVDAAVGFFAKKERA